LTILTPCSRSRAVITERTGPKISSWATHASQLTLSRIVGAKKNPCWWSSPSRRWPPATTVPPSCLPRAPASRAPDQLALGHERSHLHRLLVAGVSLSELDKSLTRKHLRTLDRLEEFTLTECDSLLDIVTEIGKPVELVYFYCHGRREELRGSTQKIPYLEVGESERFKPADITAWRRRRWPPDHWNRIFPLVFINVNVSTFLLDRAHAFAHWQ
jgi:hypothetical protein